MLRERGDFSMEGLCRAILERHRDTIRVQKPHIAVAKLALIVDTILKLSNRQGFHAILDPTVTLARRLFEAPTQYYKSGVVLLAWLNGFQDHFRMVGGAESARGILHYADLFRLADQAGLFADPERAATRMAHLCALNGIA